MIDIIHAMRCSNGADRFAPAPLFPLWPDDPLHRATAAWTTAPSGDRLRIAVLEPAAPCRGAVLLSAGRSEAIEKYGETAGDLAGRGFAVLIQEWAGQGLSGRYLADPSPAHMVGGWRRPLANLSHLLDLAESFLPKPWIAMGHSMGGGLTALALAEGERRFASAMLCAPMLAPLTRPTPFRVARMAARLMTALGRGDRPARTRPVLADVPFARNVLTHDPARYARIVALFREHPELYVAEPTWRWVEFATGLPAVLLAPGAPERIACPVAVVAAGEDALVDGRAIAAFCARLRSGRLVEIAGAYHEILAETDAVRAVFWRSFDALVG